MSVTDIESLDSPNPYHYRDFLVTCHMERINTTVTSTPAVVRNWLFRIRRHHVHRIRHGTMVVGLGVQWTPSFEAGVQNPPATLQLCVGHQCLIFHLTHAPRVPLSLRRFLTDSDITFVGVSNKHDEAMLQSSEHTLSVLNLVDLRDAASDQIGCSRRISMENLAELVLGMEGVKKADGVGRSNWDTYWLTKAQIEYACVDAFISFSIGKALKVWKWLEEEEEEEEDEYY